MGKVRPPALAALAVTVLALCVTPRAFAQAAGTAATADSYPPITDRGFTLDAYRGATVGSYRLVGMGGTSFATAEGAPSMSTNPASVASRLATWNDWFEWDWAVDTYTPAISTDYDNNGVAQGDSPGDTIAASGALDFFFGDWGIGISAVSEDRGFELATGEPATLATDVFRLTVGRGFLGRELTVGASLVTGGFTLTSTAGDGSTTTLVDRRATTFEAGALWRPPGRDLRLGGRIGLPLSAAIGEDATGCDPMDCGGYILPERVAFPWNVGAGVAWRFGPSRWNTVVHDDFRDERAVVVGADLLVTGAVHGGAGIEEFLDHRLQKSGRHWAFSLRTGAEYEWIPGRLRVRGGAYWEPGRFEGVAGRGHATLGFDLRLFGFSFLGDRYRLRFSSAADGAARYANVLFSLGFWH
jgi:hypothetical protein